MNTDKLVGATTEAYLAALADFNPQNNSESSLVRFTVDGPGEDSYPLTVLSLAVLRKEYTSITCESDRLYLGEVLWGLTNNQIGVLSAIQGYSTMPTAWSTRAINLLYTINCNGQQLLTTTLITGTGPYAPFFSAFGYFYTSTQVALSSRYAIGQGQTDVLQMNVDYAGIMSVSSAHPDLTYMLVDFLSLSLWHPSSHYLCTQTCGYGSYRCWLQHS